MMYAASKPDSIKKMFDEIVEHYGTCDVLINNAGITRDTLVMRMKPEQWQDVIDTNLSGVFYCSQAFFKVASKKRTGRIINMSSVVGKKERSFFSSSAVVVIGCTMFCDSCGIIFVQECIDVSSYVHAKIKPRIWKTRILDQFYSCTQLTTTIINIF
jgi:NAD(P)-dependent dehydrogenase (short-subunit alcohol dehydrogenase family)